MFTTKTEKYNHPDDEPYEKPHPVGNPQLCHQVEIDQQADNRDQRHLFPDAQDSNDYC